ncbi:MAG: hypothetical protein ACREQA_03565 [Candidatus Binatia bacterium]
MNNLISLVLLISSLCYFFSYPEVDNDLWGHLLFGREIVEKGRLPLQNFYSYTAPDHVWINHEWFAEVIFYGFFHFFGSPGLILLKVALGAGVIWMLDLTLRKRVSSLFVRAITLVWAMAILSPGFNIRPQIFTYFFFATFFFLFYRSEEKGRISFYWMPILTALWVNLHGGFVAGLGALGLFSLWTAITKDRGVQPRGLTMARVFISFVLCVVALVLNPYGLDLLRFLAGDLLLSRPITEWGPIPLLDFSSLGFKLAVIAVLLLAPWNGSWRRWDFVLTVLAALLALRYQRHTPLFAIAAAPLLAEGIQRIHEWLEKKANESIFAVGMLAIALYQFHWVGRIHLEHRFQLFVSPREYPTQAVDFLLRNGVRGNLAVPFDWGEYLIWKLYPEVRVSIDGRYTTAYPTEVIRDNWDWMEGKEGWRRLLERYPTEIAITNRRHPVTTLLRKDPEWVYIYSDPIAFIFVRNVSSQQELLAKFREKRLRLPQTPSIHFPG